MAKIVHLSWNYPVVCMTPKEDFVRINKDVAGGKIISSKDKSFLEIMKEIRGEVVHAYGRGLPFPELAFLFAKRAMYTPFNDSLGSKWWTRAARRFVFNRYERIVVQTEWARQNLIKEGVRPEKINVIPCPIDYKFFSKPRDGARFRKKFGLGKDEPFAITIGIRPVRNPKTIIEAAKLASIKVVLIGPYTKEDLEKTWGDKGFEWYLPPKEVLTYPNVILTGQLSAKETLAAFDAATVYVNSSLYDCYGVANLEAASAGLPLCLPRLGGYVSIFGEAVLYHDDPNDARSLAKNIRAYLASPRLRAEHGRKVKRIAARLDYPKRKKAYKRFYDDFLSSKN